MFFFLTNDSNLLLYLKIISKKFAPPKALNNIKFAQYIESIKILYLIDNEFQMICDDYCFCKTFDDENEKKSEENSQYKIMTIYKKIKRGNHAQYLE